jgi:hypothetical protein
LATSCHRKVSLQTATGSSHPECWHQKPVPYHLATSH